METKTTFTINVSTILITVLAFLMFFAALYNIGNKNDEISRWKDNYNTEHSRYQTYESAVDNLIITKNNIIQLKERELRDALMSDSIQRELVKKYRRASAAVKVEWKFHPKDTVEIEVPVYIDKDTVIDLWHDCFEVDIEIKNGKLSMYDLYIENRLDMVLGERKKGLWKTEQAFDIRNTNPCITTTGVTSYVVTVDKHWYEKWWITLPVGLATGYTYGRLSK